MQADFLERVDYLKAKLSKNGKKEFAADLWDDEEIAELGPSLRSAIVSSIIGEKRLAERIAYKGGIRAILRSRKLF